MKNAKLLDCTLRDGAYLIDKKFGKKAICGIISGLMEANIDIIEIGFLQDEEFGEGKTVFFNSADAKKFIPDDKKNTLFSLLADYSRYSILNLDNYDPASVDIIRACFFKNERYDVIEFCRIIKEKGYKLCVQPVDILGYTDSEIIELVEKVNEIEPYCLSIVDTFGSMYIDDMQRIFHLINHNLLVSCMIGMHSHNNMQMSAAISQDFINISYGKRKVIVDTTVSGMGRGAGNTPTELMAQFMVRKLGYNYDIDCILDVIDLYIDNIRTRCVWGYSTPYFVAGCYSAHVNNITYLTEKSGIRSKDIRYILNKIDIIDRKRYDYTLLENEYYEYLNSDVDDSYYIEKLTEMFKNKKVLAIAPGKSCILEKEKIDRYISKEKPIIICINHISENIDADFIYLNNVKRYNYWKNDNRFKEKCRIVTSNIKTVMESEQDYIINVKNLIKCGWNHMDNSTIMLLRLLDLLDVKSITLAGLDGYKNDFSNNYLFEEMQISSNMINTREINKEIADMLLDYKETRVSKCKISFLTKSYFDNIFDITDEGVNG
jgi:Isopropylmalate/homocitrate/citramalate synthases